MKIINRPHLALISIAGAAVVSLAAGTAAHAFTPNRVSVDNAISILQDPPGSADVVPAVLSGYDLPVDMKSLRLLGEDETASYWTGTDKEGNVCLVGYISGGNEVTGTTCSTIVDFYKRGLGLSAKDGGQARLEFEAYLLPDDVQINDLDAFSSDARPSKSHSGRTSFVTVTPGSLSDLPPEELVRGNGQEFVFYPLVNDESEH